VIRCPSCGRFLGAATAEVDCLRGFIRRVEGTCARHGVVEAAPGWTWDDFFGPGNDPCEDWW